MITILLYTPQQIIDRLFQFQRISSILQNLDTLRIHENILDLNRQSDSLFIITVQILLAAFTFSAALQILQRSHR